MAGNVLKPIAISRVNGGRLIGCKHGVEEVLEDNDVLDPGDPPTITTSLSGLTASNVAIGDDTVTIGGVEFGSGQYVVYDLVAASNATLGDGTIRIRVYSTAGLELEYEKDVTVYERLPSR